jgi:hypothetical protein
MRHVNLLFAAVTVLFGPVTALRAEPLPAPDSTETSVRDLGPSVDTAPADAKPAPAVVPPPSTVAEIAADPGLKDAPQEVKSGPIQHVEKAHVPPRRPVTHRMRLGCYSSHQSARVAKRARQARVVAPPVPVWSAGSSETQCGSIRCWKFVLLGVGY